MYKLLIVPVFVLTLMTPAKADDLQIQLTEQEAMNVLSVCLTAMKSPAVVGDEAFNFANFCVYLKTKIAEAVTVAKAKKDEKQP